MREFPGVPALAWRIAYRVGIALALAPGVAMADGGLDVPFSMGRGWNVYESRCVECHGSEGGGTDEGPPLIHPYYVPSHHSDEAIVRAILQGSRQHHWNFGDMPPTEGVSEAEAQQVAAFVRWLQAEKGLLPR